MKFIMPFFILSISFSVHAFELKDLNGCYKTISDNGQPARDSSDFKTKMQATSSIFVFGPNEEKLKVLNFALGSSDPEVGSNMGDWVASNASQGVNSIILNFKGPIIFKFGDYIHPYDLEQNVTIEKSGDDQYQINQDVSYYLQGHPISSNHVWEIQKIKCQ